MGIALYSCVIKCQAGSGRPASAGWSLPTASPLHCATRTARPRICRSSSPAGPPSTTKSSFLPTSWTSPPKKDCPRDLPKAAAWGRVAVVSSCSRRCPTRRFYLGWRRRTEWCSATSRSSRPTCSWCSVSARNRWAGSGDSRRTTCR
jgi:hypothetical protein